MENKNFENNTGNNENNSDNNIVYVISTDINNW